MSRRLGICICCGEEKVVQNHHSKGYLSSYENFTEPYCASCDTLEHNEARKNIDYISHAEAYKLKHPWYNRVRKTFLFSPEAAEKLELLSEYNGKSQSEFVEYLLDGYIDVDIKNLKLRNLK